MHPFLFGSLAVLALVPAFAEEGKPKDSPRKEKPAASSDYQALMDEYRNALKASDQVFEKARTDEERKKIRADFAAVRAKIVDRVLVFAERHPKDKDSALALFFVLHPDIHAERKAAERTIRLFMKDHLTSEGIVPLVKMLAEIAHPIGEEPLRAVLKKNPHQTVQAHAYVSLALLLKERADAKQPREAARLTEEAEKLFERVVKKHADVKEVAEKAKAELFEMRHLVIGKAMPDIKGKDSDGKELKLSDHRGKVVVIDFWATWCPPCMAGMPHKRELVKRLEGKPFVLLGINRDSSRESLKKAEEKHTITWRSFFDGHNGPISKEHTLKSMPTTYVLDARGVLRYKGVRGKEMDRAVDQLLAELEKRSAK